jgi:hypothetical protein
MPRKKPAACHALHYLGDASGVPHLSGVPSRDLSAGDLHRLAHNLGTTCAALVASAVRSGAFTEADPASPAADESPSADGEET